MENTETLNEFYKRKFDWIPENLKNGIGHFNVFQHEPIDPLKSKPLPYKRRDFYKIMYVEGEIDMIYADIIMKVKKQALFFSNPQIPYNCDNLEKIKDGKYCIFNEHFFNKFGDLAQYSVFQPAGNHVFELTDEQAKQVKPIFGKMFDEIKSDYAHKYDLLRNLVFELLHFALKMDQAKYSENQTVGFKHINASQRISTLFLELVERQFPIDENHPSIKLRTASDFASQLNIHVNHLNRAIKEITQKTTTQIIAERLVQEAKIMLKQSNWNVSEIAFALGFVEVTHFNNFFKKHINMSPSYFRKY